MPGRRDEVEIAANRNLVRALSGLRYTSVCRSNATVRFGRYGIVGSPFDEFSPPALQPLLAETMFVAVAIKILSTMSPLELISFRSVATAPG